MALTATATQQVRNGLLFGTYRLLALFLLHLQPSYRQLAALRSQLKGLPGMALTATATQQVRIRCLRTLALSFVLGTTAVHLFMHGLAYGGVGVVAPTAA
jgi:superfamily II DNA helicase RecQ